jgi:hypothetical protein
MSQFPFGRDRFEYIDDERCQTGSGLTLRPLMGETPELFEQRIDHIVRESTKLPDVRRVEWEYQCDRAGVVVECLIMMHHDPRPAPLELRAVGGRVSPRGRRGGGRQAA